MTIREAIERLDKYNFNIDYNYNKYHWSISVDKGNKKIFEKENCRSLSELLSQCLGEKVEVKQEFETTEYEAVDRIEITLNYSNTEKNDNFIYVELNRHDGETREIKNLNEFIEILETGALNNVEYERQGQIDNAEIKYEQLNFEPNGVYKSWTQKRG